MTNKVIMVCGYPASSKTSYAKSYLQQGFVHLNRDIEGGAILDLVSKLDSLLQNKCDIIIDNLFTTANIRKPFIEMCKLHQVDIECHIMETSIEQATFNAVQRAINILGTFPTPEEIKKAKHPNIFPPAVLFKYRKEYQAPDLSEGFSKIILVPFVRQINPNFTNKAVIFDYDGTLRECRGGNEKFPVSEEQIEIMPRRTEILKSYRDQGYILLGLSNQSGIHKEELSYQKAIGLFEYTNKLLDVEIDYQFCHHQAAPITCYCRKPMNGKFVEFMLKYKLSAKDSIFCGDMTTDATFAKRSGIEYVDQAEFFK
jgi:HAD superfamily hydrolase (TIGR01662 family)